jgi:hypothetical protein
MFHGGKNTRSPTARARVFIMPLTSVDESRHLIVHSSATVLTHISRTGGDAVKLIIEARAECTDSETSLNREDATRRQVPLWRANLERENDRAAPAPKTRGCQRFCAAWGEPRVRSIRLFLPMFSNEHEHLRMIKWRRGWDYSALRASPLRGRPAGVIPAS